MELGAMPELICVLVSNQKTRPTAPSEHVVATNPSEGWGILASKLSRYAVGEPRISRENASVDCWRVRTGHPALLATTSSPASRDDLQRLPAALAGQAGGDLGHELSPNRPGTERPAPDLRVSAGSRHCGSAPRR
jgi:hypothetical protein